MAVTRHSGAGFREHLGLSARASASLTRAFASNAVWDTSNFFLQQV